MLANNNYKPQQIQSVALKFQKILSLEIEQYTVERLLSNQTATHSSDFWGAYDIFPEDLTCEQCHTEFSMNYDEQKISVNITNTPTICTLWSQNRLVKNFAQIGNLVDNPFQYTSNSKGYFIFPINLTTIYNGNHSTNVALYENNTVLDNIAFMDISSWMDKIYFNHKTNTFDHLSCNAKTTNQQLFHENIGYIYEIGQFLYLNGLSISTENFS